MAEDAEALAQLARLLGDRQLHNMPPDDLRALVDARFSRLVDGLLYEATASDDVMDHQSALAFLSDRLNFFGSLISAEQRTRLLDALSEKVSAW